MTVHLNYIEPPRTALEAFELMPEGTLCQIIDNKFIMSPAPEYHHQSISSSIEMALAIFIIKNKLGEILHAPLDVYFDNENVFQPDILFISNENSSIIKNEKIKGAPDLIIEILSPATQKNDLGKKKDIYEKFGVKEYWTVQPKDKSTKVFILNKENKYIEFFSGTKKAKSKLFKKTFNF